MYVIVPSHRHATISWGETVFFCENLYQSVSFVDALMYRDIFQAICIAVQFAKNCVDTSNANRQILGATETKIGLVEIGVLRHVARLSLILVNNVPRETKSPVFWKFS